MKNKYEIRGNVTAIFLNRNGQVYECLIDTEDFEKANAYPNTWNPVIHGSRVYVQGRVKTNKKAQYTSMHRLIMDFPEGLDVDHINHSQLDNRKNNLRAVTRSQNLQNREGASSNNKSSGFRGVSWVSSKNSWKVVICVNYKYVSLGYFENIDDAVQVSKLHRAKFMPYSEEARTMNRDDFMFLKQGKQISRNKSGVRGVHWSKRDNKWVARIRIEKKNYFEKLFDNFDDAVHAIEEVRKNII